MSVLAVRTGGLGDCLLTLPVLHAIVRLHPGHDLHLLGNRMMREVAGLSGFIGATYDIDDPRFARLFGESTLDEELLEFFSRFSSLWFFSSASNADRFIEHLAGYAADRCHIIDPRPPSGFNGHIVEHLSSILPHPSPSFNAADSLPFLAGGISCEGGIRSGLVIHPGSGSLRKTWPPDRFRSVAESLGIPAVFIMGPAEHERGIAKEFHQNGCRIVSPANIRELAAVIGGASLFIGNDSGAAHLAGMLGIPTVVLFGPEDARLWQPLGKHVAVVSSANGEMTGIATDEVRKAALALIGSEMGAL